MSKVKVIEMMFKKNKQKCPNDQEKEEENKVINTSNYEWGRKVHTEKSRKTLIFFGIL